MSAATYVFRLDDIHPRMNWLVLERYLRVFEAHGVIPLLGVIPDCQDPELNQFPERVTFWEELRQLVHDGRVEICQHGYQHLYTSSHIRLSDRLIGRMKQTEFCGKSLQEQIIMLSAGYNILQKNGLSTNIFMAPSHTFDRNTLKALLHTGFTCLTDGIALYPYRYGGLLFVPQQQWAPEVAQQGVITICLHPGNNDDAMLESINQFFEHQPTCIAFSDAMQYATGANEQLVNFLYKARFLLSYQVRRLLGMA